MRALPLVVLVVNALLPTGSSADPRPAGATPFEQGPYGEVIVSARVNGQGPFRFLLDTGASHSAIGADLARAIEAPLVAKTVVGTPLGPDLRAVVRLDRLELGPLDAAAVLATVIRTDVLDPAGRIQGTIGQDVLAASRYTLDYRHRSIVWNPGADTWPSEAARLRLQLEEGRFLVELPQRGAVLRLVPDTGASGIVLFERPDGSLPPLSQASGLAALATAHGQATVREVRVRELRVGATTLRDLPAALVERGATGAAEGDGLLPLHLFDRVTFDGPAGLLVVEEGSPGLHE